MLRKVHLVVGAITVLVFLPLFGGVLSYAAVSLGRSSAS